MRPKSQPTAPGELTNIHLPPPPRPQPVSKGTYSKLPEGLGQAVQNVDLGPAAGASAAAAAKSCQSCLTLCDPIDGSPPGSAIPGILQARILGWVAISFSNAWKWKVKVKSLSRVRLLATPWTAAYQAPPSMGFSRREYWSGVPSPSPAAGASRSLLKSSFSGPTPAVLHLHCCGWEELICLTILFIYWLQWVLVAMHRIQFPDQRWNPGPWKHKVLTTGQPGKSLFNTFSKQFFCTLDCEKYPTWEILGSCLAADRSALQDFINAVRAQQGPGSRASQRGLGASTPLPWKGASESATAP